MLLTIPIIDLAQAASPDRAERAAVIDGVADAARTTGMFFVTGHGVAADMIADQFALARAFFALDFAEKMAIEVGRSNCFRGYEPYGSQTIDRTAPGDLKEGFIMGPDLPPDHPHVRQRYPNTGTNLWPQRPADFRPRMERYVAAMNALGRRLAALLALSLDLPASYFAAALDEPLTYSQLLHYPPVPNLERCNLLGAGAHVDWGLLTILLQDDVGGLEVRAPDGRWHGVTPVPETFVIILGEMILRLTDGRYRSAMHRVLPNASGASRYSMPTFFDPGYDWRVGCVPTCRPAQGEPRYPEVTVAEHMQEMARTTLSAA